MKNFLRKTLVAAAILAGSAAQAADLSAVKAAVESHLTDVTVSGVHETPFAGLFEVDAGRHVFYTDAGANYFLVGTLVDAKTRADLTAPREQALAAVSFDKLPLDLAFKEVRGNGKRRMAIFTDPDCPFCKQLEKGMAGVTNVTIYRFLFPIASLHPNAPAKSRAIWCAGDRLAAWNAAMAGRAVAGDGKCATPIDKIAQLGESLNVDGTPTIVFGNGRMVPGAVPAAELEKLLDAPAAR